MGGGVAGEVASRLAVERISEALARRTGSLSERIRTGVAAANRAIREHSVAKLDGAESGSTMVLALVSGGRVTVAHIGDSRAYRFRQGRLEQLTADHTFVAEQVRAGLIPPERVATHPLRSRLTKALGVAETVEAAIADHELRADDVLLLCSDGLHGMAGDDEISAAIGGGIHTLVALANANGGRDNVTVALLRAPGGQFAA